jgi:threonine dehydrogenase-like Zn-dependent dehydrogenase
MRAIFFTIKPLGWVACRLLRPLWKGCLLSGLGGLSLRDVPPPELPGDDWVRCRTRLGGICGTDLAIVGLKQPPNSILQAFSSMPIMLGHENVAVVEETGPAVEPSWKGRRVCVEPTLGCTARGIEPACPRCRAGEFGSCENFGADGLGRYGLPPGTSIGYNRRTGGSLGEWFVAHKSQLVAVPESISDEEAILTDPLACGMHAALRCGWERAEQVLVYGAGIIGLSIIGGLRALGFRGRIDAIDPSPLAAEFAKKFGADEVLRLPPAARERFEEIARRTGATVHRSRFENYMLSGGYDVVFDCVGSAQSTNESLKWARARGEVVLVATGHGGAVDLTPIWFRELSILGAYGRQFEHVAGGRVGTYQLVHEMMTKGKLSAAGLLTHTFRIAEYRKAFDVAMNKGRHRAMKVAIDFR